MRAEDDYTWLNTPGWTQVGGEGAGVWNVTINDFDPVIAPDGENVVYTENPPADTANGVAQVLTETFAAHTDYTLTAEVGNSWFYYWSGYSVQLLAGGTVIAEDKDTLWPSYMKWATSTVGYTYDLGDSALVGEPLEIRLLNLGLDKDNPPGNTVGVEFDDVRLDANPAWGPGVSLPNTDIKVTADATVEFATTESVSVGGLTVANGFTATLAAGPSSISFGTAGGQGTIAGDFSVTDTLAPGASVGKLTVDGSLSLAAESVYEWELGLLTSGGEGIDWDLLDVTADTGLGNLTVEDGMTLKLLDATGLLPTDESFSVVGTDLVVFTYAAAAVFDETAWIVDRSDVDNWDLVDSAVEPTLWHDVPGKRVLLQGFSIINPPPPNEWLLSGPGPDTFNDASHWSDAVIPNGVDVQANFATNIAAPSVVTVDEPVTMGTINFDNADYSYTIAGPATITLEASGDPQIIVQAGDHTISAPLSFAAGLTVNTADATRLTLDPAVGYSAMEGTLTKDGPGTLALGDRVIVVGDLNHNGGVLEVGPGVLALPGGNVTLGDGATLRASGSVNRRVIGGPASTLEAAGGMNVGDSGDPDGYAFQGKLKVGSHIVGLMDSDLAKVYRGATIAGGTLGSIMGIELQSGTVFQRTIKGPGTIAGNVRFNGSSVAGISLAQPLVFPGVVEGLGTFSFAQFTGLLRLGASPVYIPSSGGNQFQGTLLAEIWGPNPGQASFDETAFDIVGEADPQGYHQFGIFDGTALGGAPTDTLGGTLQIDLFGGYVPLPGDEFRIFEAVAIPLPPELGFPGDEFPAGNFTGWFDTVVLGSGLTGDWLWRWEYPDHSTELGPAVGGRPSQDLFLSATLTIVPEPGTLVLLLSGVLGLLLLVWRRKRS